MAAVFCKFCGEPCDMGEFRNGTNSCEKIYRLFKEYGCPIAELACDGLSANEMLAEKLTKCNREPIVDEERLDKIDIIQDMLEDDIDGASSMLSD